MRRNRNGRSWCPYCGFGPCRSTARTSSGHDLALFHKHHSTGVSQPTTMTNDNNPEGDQP